MSHFPILPSHPRDADPLCPLKWQPIMLVVNHRLECVCGSMAIFVTGRVDPKNYNALNHVDLWCQPCFVRAQEEVGQD